METQERLRSDGLPDRGSYCHHGHDYQQAAHDKHENGPRPCIARRYPVVVAGLDEWFHERGEGLPRRCCTGPWPEMSATPRCPGTRPVRGAGSTPPGRTDPAPGMCCPTRGAVEIHRGCGDAHGHAVLRVPVSSAAAIANGDEQLRRRRLGTGQLLPGASTARTPNRRGTPSRSRQTAVGEHGARAVVKEILPVDQAGWGWAGVLPGAYSRGALGWVT
jgi:hypothetical protein